MWAVWIELYLKSSLYQHFKSQIDVYCEKSGAGFGNAYSLKRNMKDLEYD